jgi:hypothetical protein
VDYAIPAGDDRPWRVRAAIGRSFGGLVQELFVDDPAADRALAIVDDPASPDSCAVALAAARDAISSGQLVMITHGPGLTGFCASLHAEHPELGVTVLRVPESAEGLRAARRYAAADPGTFRELVIDTAGQVHETFMAPAETGEPGGEFPLGPGDVVLVSRGASGAGLALAQVLACCGAPIALIGREGPGEAAEVEAGLGRLRSAGVRMSIESVDVANAADLRRALQRVERRLGPVTAVAHAVGVGGPLPIAELTEDDLRAHISAETASLHQLVTALTAKRLRLIVTFGSVAGRYGLAGEGLLALASGSLAERAERMSDSIPGCGALHVDWPAWSGSGLGQRASLAERLERSGATPIPVKEGSRLLLKTLATQELPARVAVHGRVGVPGPRAIAAAWPRGKVGRGRFLQQIRVHYPGVELVCDARLTHRADPYLADYQVDGTTVLPAVMALEAMAQAATALTGRPMRRLTRVLMMAPVVVPAATVGVPALIRICALREGASVTAVIRCAESGFGTDHFLATFHGGDEAADAAAPSLLTGLPELDEMPASHSGIVDGTELYGPICFQSGRFRRVALLPEVTSRSCRALVRGGDDGTWFGEQDGQAVGGSVPDASVLDISAADSLVLGSPGLNDATWHVLQACVPHRRLLPAGCESVTFSGREADGAVEIRAVEVRGAAGAAGAAGREGQSQGARPEAAGIRGVVPEPRSGTTVPLPGPAGPGVPAQGQGPEAVGPGAIRAATQDTEYVWDVEAVDSAGQPLVTWRGLRLADAGPLPRSVAWPPSLLSVYLERSAAALGLHPDLRVTVQCGQPDSTGQQPAVAPQTGTPQTGAPPTSVPPTAGPRTAGPRTAGPPTSVPRPSPSPDRLPLAVPGGRARERAAYGRGDLDGFVLSVWAPEGAACGWEAAVPGAAPGPEPSPGLADIEAQLRTGRGEPPAIVGAMLQAVADCLAMAGAPDAPVVVADEPRPTGGNVVAEGTVVADGAARDDWLVLRAGKATLACTVAEISGVSCPVAIAVMTGGPGQEDESRSGSGRRQRRQGTRRAATATREAPASETGTRKSASPSAKGRS